jgi:hypothetical protein
LGLLPFANGVHYDSEEQRRPLIQRLMKEGVIPPVAYCTDDRVGILFEGTDATEVIVDLPREDGGPWAWHTAIEGGETKETRWGVGPLTH